MRKIAFLLALLVLFPLLTMADETPKAEIFGGYQYTRLNIEGTGLNFNGWNASITGNINRNFGVAADFSGAYKSESGASLKIYSYTFGPVLSLNHEGVVNPFVHALFGGAHATASVTGLGSAGENGFAMMMGGGVDAKIAPRIAVRLVQVDWAYYRFSGVGESKNVRISTGLVFRF
jgi:hypothetical protein